MGFGKTRKTGSLLATLGGLGLIIGAWSNSWWSSGEIRVPIGIGLRAAEYCFGELGCVDSFHDDKVAQSGKSVEDVEAKLSNLTGMTSTRWVTFGKVACFIALIAGPFLFLAGWLCRDEDGPKPLPVGTAVGSFIALGASFMFIKELQGVITEWLGTAMTPGWARYAFIGGGLAGLAGSVLLAWADREGRGRQKHRGTSGGT